MSETRPLFPAKDTAGRLWDSRGRMIRFAGTGFMTTAVHAGVAEALIRFVPASSAVANGAAYAAAAAFGYLAQTLWSFSQPLSRRSLARFLAVSAFGCGLAAGIAKAADLAGLDYRLGLLCVVVILPPATFLAHQYWTYR